MNEHDSMKESKRMNELLEVIQKIAAGDLTVNVSLSENQDEIDALATGINLMIEEIKIKEDDLKESKESLLSKVNELEKFNKLVIRRELKMIELKKRVKELEEKLRNK